MSVKFLQIIIIGIYSISFSKPYFGAFYQQTANNLFSAGLIQFNPGEKLPVDQFMQLGYTHDRRYRESYKGKGNGVSLEFGIAPRLEFNAFKAGIYGSFFGLMEAYWRKDLNAYWRERDAGFSAGAYGAYKNNFFLRLGVFRAIELSKFIFASYYYPRGFCFNISAAFKLN